MENRDIIKESEFLEFYNSRSYNANCFNSDGSLNKNYNSFKKTGLIATIFEDHWESFANSHKDIVEIYRPNADVVIHKIIDCYNKNLGCSVYECPTCHDIIFVGHTCKSRLCSSCGYKYKNERVESILQTAYNCQHRQIDSFPFPLSGETVAYICPKCKYKFDAPIEAVLEFEQEDDWNGLPISTPPYTICAKCNFDKCVPIYFHICFVTLCYFPIIQG